nr:NifU family protein [Mycoplasmoidaceae bacterium]
MANNNQTRVVERIKELVEALRVYINADGGDMEFVSYENKILTLRILG